MKPSPPRATAVFCLVLLLSAVSGRTQQGLEEEPTDALYDELAIRLQDAEQELAAGIVEDRPAVTAGQVDALSNLDREIRSSPYGDLIDKSGLLLLLTRERMRFQQEDEQQRNRADRTVGDSLDEKRREKTGRIQNKVLRVSTGSAVASFSLAFAFWGLGEMQDQLYFEAQTIDRAVLHRRLFQAFSIGSLISAAIGVLSSGVSAYLLAAEAAR